MIDVRECAEFEFVSKRFFPSFWFRIRRITIIMFSVKRIVPLALASATGIISGIYIFKPIILASRDQKRPSSAGESVEKHMPSNEGPEVQG